MKDQAEGNLIDDDDLSDTIASIIVDSTVNTSTKVLQKVNEVSTETEEKISLGVLSKIPSQQNYDTKLEILVSVSTVAENELETFLVNSVTDVSTNEDLEIITDILVENKKVLPEKLINTATSSEENEKKITESLVTIINENPEVAIDLLNKNKDTKKMIDIVKTKIESDEAITIEDFDEVFDENISPN